VSQGFDIQFMLETMQDLIADHAVVSQADYRLTFGRERFMAQAAERCGRFGGTIRFTVP
jgi:hypothetical protein